MEGADDDRVQHERRDADMDALRLGGRDNFSMRGWHSSVERREYAEDTGFSDDNDGGYVPCDVCGDRNAAGRRKRKRTDSDASYEDEEGEDSDEYRDDEENMTEEYEENADDPDDGPPRLRRAHRTTEPSERREVGESVAAAESESNIAYMRDPSRLSVSRPTAETERESGRGASGGGGSGGGSGDDDTGLVPVSLDEAHRGAASSRSDRDERVMEDLAHQIRLKMEDVRETARQSGRHLQVDLELENSAANEVARILGNQGQSEPSESDEGSGEQGTSYPGATLSDAELRRESDEFAETIRKEMRVMNVDPDQLKHLLCPLCYLNLEAFQHVDENSWRTIESMCIDGIGNLDKDTHALIVAFMYNTTIYRRLRKSTSSVPPLTFEWAKRHLYDTDNKHRIVRRAEIYNDVETLGKKITILKNNIFVRKQDSALLAVRHRESMDLNRTIELKHKLLALKCESEPFVNQSVSASMHQGGPLNGFAAVKRRKRRRFT